MVETLQETSPRKQTPTILRRKQVEARTGLSRTAIYAGISDGTFPAPISIGSRSVGWIEAEVVAWIESRIKASRSQSTAGEE